MWGIRYGRWWALQWRFDHCYSFGVHIDLMRRPHAIVGSFGPYIDFHLLVIILSIGNNPAHSGELERCISVSRGGLPQ